MRCEFFLVAQLVLDLYQRNKSHQLKHRCYEIMIYFCRALMRCGGIRRVPPGISLVRAWDVGGSHGPVAFHVGSRSIPLDFPREPVQKANDIINVHVFVRGIPWSPQLTSCGIPLDPAEYRWIPREHSRSRGNSNDESHGTLG